MKTETKKCSKCGRVLPLSAFHTEKSRKDGHQAYCSECMNEYQRNRYREIVLESGDRLKEIREKRSSYYYNIEKKHSKMNIRFKTTHGRAILSVPDGFPVDSDVARATAVTLDSVGTEWNVGSARITLFDSQAKYLGFMSWTTEVATEK